MIARMVFACALTAVTLVAWSPRASGAPAPGAARVVAPNGGAASPSLGAGGSRTEFTLALPDGAACPGDSANDGYRVQSYMVAGSVDPASLTFGSTGPRPAAVGAALRQPLYQTTSSAYANAQTANADFPGDTGAIVNVPAFSFAVYEPGNIAAGAYNIGIACTKGPASATQLVRYWNATISVTADAADTPAGIAWRVDGAGSPATAPSLPAPSATVGRAASDGAAHTADVDAPAGTGAPQVAADAAVTPAPTGAAPNLSAPVLQIPAYVRSPISSGVVAAAWALALAVLARVGWLAARARHQFDARRLSVLEDE